MHSPTDPGGHGVGVRLAVVVVEDHDGGDDAAGHHEHDAVEVGSCGQFRYYLVYDDIMTDYERKEKELLIPSKV